MINLAILEESPLIRLGLENLIVSLNPDIQNIIQVASVPQLLQETQGKQLDLLIADLVCTQETPQQRAEQLMEICHSNPLTQLVIYSYNYGYCEETLSKLYQHPLVSLISRLEDQQQTSELFTKVIAGFKICSPTITRDIKKQRHESYIIQKHLTPSEREVLVYLFRGLSLQDMAIYMNRSIKTLSAHKQNAKQKLGVKNDAQLFSLKEHFIRLNRQCRGWSFLSARDKRVGTSM